MPKLEMAQSLSEAVTKSFDNQEQCDVAFTVEGECIKAHKLVLTARSKVLADLSSEWNPGMDPIPINTIDFTSFKTLLRYLYSGEMELTKDNMFVFLSASVNFKMDYLEQECISFIEGSLNSENVCHFMNEAVLFKSALLQEKCMKLIEKDTNDILLCSITQLSQPALSVLLEADELNIIENVLFYYIKHWMKAKCEEQNIDSNGENMRQVIGDALYKIRFPTMTAQDFANCVTTIDGFLTDSEMRTTFQKIMVFKNDKIECPFPSEFRCRNNSMYSAFRDMKELVEKKVLYQLNGTECYDTKSLACHIKNLETGEDMFPPSFRLLMQCCADMANSCHDTIEVSQTNHESRKIVYEKLLKWEEAAVSDPKNISEHMNLFMDFRSHSDELAGWL